MKPKKYKVNLREDQRKELEGITKRGKHSAATIRRANILLSLDENHGGDKKQTEIAERYHTTTTTIYNISRQFAEEGLQATVYCKVREMSPIQPIATGDVEARIIALACGTPPEERGRWTLRLLEKKVVELHIVEAISGNTIGRLLKKHHLSLT
ncbi:MAG: helix-turn-helix domain-containing protein [Clostridia bacterium]|nr:helix-turn-helix domain-containing protein [Clostridia bacterium]